jgi:hypothetical protein
VTTPQINGPNGGLPVYQGGYNFLNLTAAGNYQVKSGPGVFGRICTNVVGTTSTAKLYDGASGNPTITIAAPGIFSMPNSFVGGEAVVLTTTGALPTGLTAGTTVFVAKDANLSSSQFAVSDTKPHALAGTNQITTTGTQSGIHTLWNINNPIGTYSTTVLGPLEIDAGFTLGLIAILSATPGDLTILYN